jgi:hypothetical protein
MSLISSLSRFDHGGFWHPCVENLSFYCMIPKNASSWTSQLLTHNGWIEGQISETGKEVAEELIVILRDPVERWIAGIAQYLSSDILHTHWYDRSKYSESYKGKYINGKPNYEGTIMSGQDFVNNYNELTERLLFEQIAFDDHTQRQSWFVNHFHRKTTTWFYLDHEFEKQFLENYRELEFKLPDIPDRNQGNANNDVKIITEFLTNRIQKNPYLKHNIERYYQDDYDMIEKANFVYFDLNTPNDTR